MPMWMFFAASLRPGISRARRAGAAEYRVVFFRQHRLQAVDVLAAAKLDADVQDVIHFLVDHRLGEAELGNLRADHAARLLVAVEYGDFIAKRRQIARDGQRRGAGADQRNAFAVFLRRRFRQPRGNVVFVIGGDALQAADRDGFRFLAVVFFDAAAAARGLAWPIAGAAQNSGKYIRFPVHHVCVAVAAGGDQADVFGNRCVRRTRPLAIYYLMKIVGLVNIGRLQIFSSLRLMSFFAAQLLLIRRITREP